MDVFAKCTKPYTSKDGISYGCGQCPNCKKSKALEWSIRARHELIENPVACFITLTYDPEHLRRDAIRKENGYDMKGVIHQKDIQDFLKRVRKVYGKIRYIYCAEYGPNTWRPHYHMLCYGIDNTMVNQAVLNKLWGNGYVDMSNQFVTDNAISYIVGYIKKKIPNKDGAYDMYEKNNRPRPYMRASQGLGGIWCDKNLDDWTSTLTVAFKNARYPVPRYYIKRIKKKEGRTIKYDIEKIEITGKKKMEYGYKVIENPEGRYTRMINEKVREIQKKGIEKWKSRYNVTDEEVMRVGEMYMNIHDEREVTRYMLDKLTDEDIERQWRRTIDKRVIERMNGMEYESGIEEETRNRLQSIARRKEWEYKHGNSN